MKCRACGVEVPAGMAVCPSCGAKLMRHLSDADAVSVAASPAAEGPSVDEGLSRQRRRAAKARLRSERAAWRRGVAMRDDPHLHTHVSGRFDLGHVRGAAEMRRDGQAHKRRVMLSCLLATLFVVAVAAYATWSVELWGGRAVPDVRGMSATDASARLVEEGFLVAMIDRADDSSVGLVVDMDPEPGERVSGGESVTLYVGVSGETEASEGVTSEGDQATRSDRATAVATTDASE